MIWNYNKKQNDQFSKAAFDVAEDLWEVTADDLTARDRRQLVVKMRTILISLLADRQLSTRWVARQLKRHHATVAYAIENHDGYLEEDSEYAQNYKAAKAKFEQICEERDLRK